MDRRIGASSRVMLDLLLSVVVNLWTKLLHKTNVLLRHSRKKTDLKINVMCKK